MAEARADLLALVKSEREQSIGFDLDEELTEARTRALDYYKGVMPDFQAYKGRANAVSTDIADIVETMLPDLVEIFVGGDDVVSFKPQRADDEEQAQQETDYVHQVVFGENKGFLTLYTFFKDALVSKTGVVKAWWEDRPDAPRETFTGKTGLELALAAQDGQPLDVAINGVPLTTDTQLPPGWQDSAIFSFEMEQEGPDGHVEIKPVAPEDFTVARDTVWLDQTTYCAMRSHPRAQELIADGHDPDLVSRLPLYSSVEDERVKQARDTAGEHYLQDGEGDGGDSDLRLVELVEHFIRIPGEAGRLELWRVLTGAEETVLLKSEQVDRIPFAAITPFIVTHRFYGESIADKLLELQRIKTALTRASLDHAAFSLNQRYEIDMTKVGATTISDVLDNVPGRPIRVKASGAVTPIQSAAAPYDFFAGLEYFATQAESRTGVIRASQGLDPDTLHKTAAGAGMLLNESQKRTRFIARIFAETGVKDLMLNVHALLRKHASKAAETRLRGKWVAVDPTQWGERNDMTVELGVGSGGRQQKLAALTQIIGLQKDIITMPGGAALVQPANAYRAIVDAGRAAGLQAPEQYFTDPSTAPPPSAPPPNPEMLRLQAQQQGDAAKRQQDAQAEQMKDEREGRELLSKHQLAQAKLTADAALEHARLQAQQADAARAHELAVAKLQQDGSLRVAEMNARSRTSLEVANIGAETKDRATAAGMMTQASESADVALEAQRSREHEAAMAGVDHLLARDAAQLGHTHAMGEAALGHLADHHEGAADRAHAAEMADGPDSAPDAGSTDQ